MKKIIDSLLVASVICGSLLLQGCLNTSAGKTDGIDTVQVQKNSGRPEYICPLKSDPPPVPDGDDRDWSTIRTEYIIGPENISWGKAKYTDADDLSGSIKFCYDANYLYFLANVVDETIIVEGGARMFNTDHVELDFVPNLPEDATGTNIEDLRIIGFIPGSVEETGDPLLDLEAEAFLACPVGIDWSGIDAGASMTEDGYILEARVPWRVLGIKQSDVKPGLSFGMELHFSDSDAAAVQETLTTMNERVWRGRRYEDIPRFTLGGTDKLAR